MRYKLIHSDMKEGHRGRAKVKYLKLHCFKMLLFHMVITKKVTINN